MQAMDLQAWGLTLKLAFITTLLLLMLGMPLAWQLARMHSKAKIWLEAVIALPLVLPPTVLGFYLLLAFSPQALPGQLWQQLTHSQLAFSFSGIVIASVLYSLPFVVQPMQKAFENIDPQLLEAAAVLGASSKVRFMALVLPLCKTSIFTAAGLGFAHTLGEFGVILMIGGNIPGETRVLSIALFEHVESLQFQQAHWLAASLLIASLLMLVAIYRLGGSGASPLRAGFKAAVKP